MRKTVILVLTLALAVVAAPARSAGSAKLPAGYGTWAKSAEKIVTDKSSLFYGIHYTYVDMKALPAYQNGSGYPEGSQFVVEFFNLKDEGGRLVKGKKNMVVLMKKDRQQSATGGWLFAGFSADGKPSGIDPVKNCFECHQKDAKERDFVISKFADFKK